MHFLLSRRRSTQTWVGRQLLAGTRHVQMHTAAHRQMWTRMQTRAAQRKAHRRVITTDTHRQAGESRAKTSDLRAIFIQNSTKVTFCQGYITDDIIVYFWDLWTSDVSHWSLLISPPPPSPKDFVHTCTMLFKHNPASTDFYSQHLDIYMSKNMLLKCCKISLNRRRMVT